MAVLDETQFEQLKTDIKDAILAESQGVGDVDEVDSLSGINSLPALKGTSVVVAPLALLSQPAEEAAARADAAVLEAVQTANDAVAQAQTDINAAIEKAEDTANHPTYIGTDNYVYVWDKTAQTYNKTSIYVRGEGFKISKTYKSIAEMEADTSHGLGEGDFVLINTDDVENPDNAKIYVVGAEGAFAYLVDMSGAIGFTGKTPQLEIGITTIGTGREDASATLTENGLDEEGNPIYLINLRIPSITLSDLTEDEIALLQSPANNMIVTLQETDEAIKSNEEARKEAESAREEAESARVEAESARVEAESAREEAESARVTAENTRNLNENARKTAEATRISNENIRLANEDSRKAAENTRVASENARVSAENTRASQESDRVDAEKVREAAENTRQSQEQTRQSNESVRIASEETRDSNEETRESNETARKSNETKRQNQESARVDAETARAEEYEALKEDILEATQNANDAATESRNTPIIKDGTWWIWSVENDAYVDTSTPATSKSPQIQNGTWWTWDDDNAQYVDTGQAVSSDYQLTKEKIEGVFQGNITSHYHSQYAEKTEIPTKVSELENDKGYLTEHISITHLATKEELTNGLKEKQDAIEDLEAIRSGAALGATAIQESDLIAKGYATETALNEGLGKKQDTISDLETIRSGAALGATAIQEIPSEYVTESELEAKGYLTEHQDISNLATKEELTDGLSEKQDLNLYFTNLTASEWVEDTTYENYGYRCDLVCEGVDETMFAQVIYDVPEWESGEYAPICETKDGIISVWSARNDTIVVPTIIVSK